jgi:hypothetical protein
MLGQVDYPTSTQVAQSAVHPHPHLAYVLVRVLLK